jgi:hypothetical protein
MAKGIRGGLLPEDDPIYSEPWTIFVPRPMRSTPAGPESEVEDQSKLPEEPDSRKSPKKQQ